MKLELLSHMGDDDMVANAARISMAKLAPNYTPEQNEKLIKFLSRNNHFSPFAHPQIQFRVTMPIFMSRQYFKHIVGSIKNEISRRYVSDEPTFYIPEWHKAPEKSIKQGSGEAFDDDTQQTLTHILSDVVKVAGDAYLQLLEAGVAPEQARMVLPQSMYTQVIDTGSLYYWARMYNQRTDPHAQKEWQELMIPLNETMSKLFPISWRELTSGKT